MRFVPSEMLWMVKHCAGWLFVISVLNHEWQFRMGPAQTAAFLLTAGALPQVHLFLFLLLLMIIPIWSLADFLRMKCSKLALHVGSSLSSTG